MTREEVVKRAQSAIGRKITYSLTCGGPLDKEKGPEDQDARCNCTSFGVSFTLFAVIG